MKKKNRETIETCETCKHREGIHCIKYKEIITIRDWCSGYKRKKKTLDI